ncbi:MAG: phosphoribosylamine--glycine ligase [Clostridiales bacterium]|jgi:phosphoribosylamine--glycine ligase|nr:phosphoribosylamine--glycine ligase [Clostridiales bacterium]
MDILIIGSGGREHAIAWSLKNSKRTEKLYAIPGNAGIAELAECHSEIGVMEFDKILAFVAAHPSIGLTVVAPDDPLAEGLVDLLNKNGFRAFGPIKSAARLEASKSFSKSFMKKYAIPTASCEVFDDYGRAREYVLSSPHPLVVKADGLAVGKGVLICKTPTESLAALKELMLDKRFGRSGDRVVIEEFLEGPEITVLSFTDGNTIVPMVSSQDHKRAFDGDKGLNTGGMGTFSPSRVYTAEIEREFREKIMNPTLDGLKAEGIVFRGVLYFGLMLTRDGLKVIEYNSRFGDPETQVILPRLKTDLLEIFNACTDGTLDKIDIEWEDCACVCVILASGGYPAAFKKGLPITVGALDRGILLFHAGTAKKDGVLVTSGGRVLGVTAKGKDIGEAREKAYRNIEKITFEGMHYRTDIGIKIES